jgi:hypothetical protein
MREFAKASLCGLYKISGAMAVHERLAHCALAGPALSRRPVVPSRHRRHPWRRPDGQHRLVSPDDALAALVLAVQETRKKQRVDRVTLALAIARCREAMHGLEDADTCFSQGLAERPDDFVVLSQAAEFHFKRRSRNNWPDTSGL